MTNTCPIDGAELAPGAVICAGCTNRARTELRSVRATLADLDVTLARLDSRTSHGVGDLEQPPVDYDIEASDAARKITRAVRVYAYRWTCDHPPTPERARTVELLMTTIPGRAALLAGVPNLGALPWSPLLAEELHDGFERADKVKQRTGATEFAGCCPNPLHGGRGPALYAAPGSATVRCRACGETWDVAASRAELVAAIPREADRLLPLKDIAVLLGKPIGTLRRWVSEKRLTHHAVNTAGQPVYWVVPIADAVRRGVAPDKPSTWELRGTNRLVIQRHLLPSWEGPPNWFAGMQSGDATGTFRAYRDGVHVLTYDIAADGTGTVTDVLRLAAEQKAAAPLPSPRGVGDRPEPHAAPTPPGGTPCPT